jgi:hypothetical protein
MATQGTYSASFLLRAIYFPTPFPPSRSSATPLTAITSYHGFPYSEPSRSGLRHTANISTGRSMFISQYCTYSTMELHSRVAQSLDNYRSHINADIFASTLLDQALEDLPPPGKQCLMTEIAATQGRPNELREIADGIRNLIRACKLLGTPLFPPRSSTRYVLM